MKTLQWVQLRLIIPITLLPLVVCAGCATNNPNPLSPPLTEQSQLLPQHGLVVVRFVILPSHSQYASSDSQSLSIQTLPSGREFVVGAFNKENFNTSEFVAQLPAGRYKLTELRGSGLIEPLTAAPFSIHTGSITNLGTLVLQFVKNDPTTRKFHIGHVDSVAELNALVTRNFPVIARLAQDNPVQVWPYGVLTTAKQVGVASVSNTPALNNPVVLADGRIFAGSQLGRILVRSDNRWTSLETDSTLQIATVLPVSSSTLLAGGEEGLLLLSKDNGRSWRNLVPPVQDGVVWKLVQGMDGRIYAGMRLHEEFVVYWTESVENPIWHEAQRLPFLYNSHAGSPLLNTMHPIEPVARPQLFSTPQFVIAMSPNKDYERIATYSLATKSWQVQDGPGVFRSVTMAPEGILFGSSRVGILYGTMVSQDGGQNWMDLNSRYWQPVFLDRNTGFALKSSYPRRNQKLLIYKTTDAGKTWNEVSYLDNLASMIGETKLFADIKNRILYAVMQNGDIYQSKDEGATWAADRIVFAIKH